MKTQAIQNKSTIASRIDTETWSFFAWKTNVFSHAHILPLFFVQSCFKDFMVSFSVGSSFRIQKLYAVFEDIAPKEQFLLDIRN